MYIWCVGVAFRQIGLRVTIAKVKWIHKKINVSSLTPPRIYSPVVSAMLAKLMNAESPFKCMPNKVLSASIEVITLNEGLIFVNTNNKIVSLPCSQLGSKWEAPSMDCRGCSEKSMALACCGRCGRWCSGMTASSRGPISIYLGSS